MDKTVPPGPDALKKTLGKTSTLWLQIEEFVKTAYPKVTEEWHYSGSRYGWNYRLRDRKRVIVYLLPRQGYFLSAFVFGEKAFQHILQSSIDESIKQQLREAKAYAEGRGIRIQVREKTTLEDIFHLVTIKLNH